MHIQTMRIARFGHAPEARGENLEKAEGRRPATQKKSSPSTNLYLHYFWVIPNRIFFFFLVPGKLTLYS